MLPSQQMDYALLSWADKGENITIRDDQHDFSWILDSIKISRNRGSRFRLMDSGRFSCYELEWLAEAGADIYTSDEVRADSFELELLGRACGKGKAALTFFHHGRLDSGEGEGESDSLVFSDVMNLGASGVYIHMTNKQKKRDFSGLNSLAYSCQKGGSWLVYYHYGPLEVALEELARSGAWIHISEQSLQQMEKASMILDIIKEARSSGTNMVLHLEKAVDFSLLEDILNAGAHVVLDFAVFDYRSPYRILEKKAKKKKLDSRSYYLYPYFLP